jgi:hypothetical protein
MGYCYPQPQQQHLNRLAGVSSVPRDSNLPDRMHTCNRTSAKHIQAQGTTILLFYSFSNNPDEKKTVLLNQVRLYPIHKIYRFFWN